MTYKAGSYIVGESDLTVFLSDRETLTFKGLSKPAIKGIMLAKVEYAEFALGEVKIETPVPPLPAER